MEHQLRLRVLGLLLVVAYMCFDYLPGRAYGEGEIDDEGFLLGVSDFDLLNDKGVYDNNSLKEFCREQDPEVKLAADSVVSLWDRDYLLSNGNGTSTLLMLQMDRHARHFHGQDAGFIVWCSGFLVSNDTILTTHHCLNTTDDGKPMPLESVVFVFGFRLLDCDRSARWITIPDGEIYGGQHILAQDPSRDYAIVRLTREVENHRPLKITSRRGHHIASGTPLYLVGHPRGRPLTIARDDQESRVVHPSWGYGFNATVDAFKGNSGSPCINSLTHEVEGILSEGLPDFKADGDLAYYNSADGQGEYCFDISPLADFLEGERRGGGGEEDE